MLFCREVAKIIALRIFISRYTNLLIIIVRDRATHNLIGLYFIVTIHDLPVAVSNDRNVSMYVR